MIKSIIFIIISIVSIYELFRIHKAISRFNYKVEHIEQIDDLYNFLYEEED